MTDDRLNYHHLYYFWAVALDGNLTRAAARLRVSQSALSTQIKQLERALGEPLFLREGRRLLLSEGGRLALGYANEIFSAGQELVSTLRGGRRREDVLRLGSVATLSRNFQESFVRPLLDEEGVRLRLVSGSLEDLVERLGDHELDLVLSNRPPRREVGVAWRCRRVARQPVSVVGRARSRPFRFPEDLRSSSMILPGPANEVRTEFDALCGQLGIEVTVLAEVDDMATMRLLVRDTGALGLLPSVVVRDELRDRVLHEHCLVPDLHENFYAITVERHYQHPLLRPLLARDEAELLVADAPSPRRPRTRSGRPSRPR